MKGIIISKPTKRQESAHKGMPLMRHYRTALETIFVLLLTTACSVNSAPPFVPTATLALGMGRITGILQVGTEDRPQPAKNAPLYLAQIIKNSAGQDGFAELDRIHSPRAVTDGQGHFVFSNVPPGKYGLILDVIKNSFLLMKPDSREVLLIEVAAGNQIDLGRLLYASLPLLSQP